MHTQQPDSNERGFSLIASIFIIMAVALLAATGYLVYYHQTQPTALPRITAQDAAPTQQTSSTDGWYLYTSSDGNYKIRLANGLTFVGNAYSSSIYTVDPIVLGSTAAKVTYDDQGKDGGSGIFINYVAKGGDISVAGEKQQGFMTDQGLTVEKYYYTEATEKQGLGLGKGSKEYTYRIEKGGKTLIVAYAVSATQTANVDLAEKMVETVEL